MNRLMRENAKGFTLIEILMAVVIFSIVISILFSSFKAFVSSSEAVKSSLARTDTISAVFRQVQLDLEALFVLQPPQYKQPEPNADPDPYRMTGREIAVGQKTLPSLSFASLMHAACGLTQRIGVARIQYYLKENSNHTYTLYRADSLPPYPAEGDSCNDPVLCRDVSDFKIQYYDFKGNEYTHWDSDAEEFDYMFPASILLTLTLDSNREKQAYQIRIGLTSGRQAIE